MQIDMSGITHTGMVRKVNQDHYFCDKSLMFAVVADGIGGRKGGEVASKLAVDSLKQSYYDEDHLRPTEVRAFLLRALETANKTILQHGLTHQECSGMGTTINVLLFSSGHLYLAHIGDSRTYLFQDNQLWQLTYDHNVKEFVKRGLLKKQENMTQKGEALMMALGLQKSIQPNIYEIKLQPGQIFLSCSDGLTTMVKDQTIKEVMQQYQNNLETMLEIFVKTANKNGGRDNITIVASKVDSK